MWLTREPLPAQAWEPRTWHRYQYAYASPISYYDPYGLQSMGPGPTPTPPPYTPVPWPTPTPGPSPTPPQTPTPTPTATPIEAQCSPFRSPDYALINLAGGPPQLSGTIGIGISLVRDRYGRIYFTFGLSVGESAPLLVISGVPISGNISGGWLMESEKPDPQDLQRFLTGWGGNVNLGFIVGLGGTTTLPSFSKWSIETGLYSPQFGISIFHSWLIWSPQEEK